MNLMKWKSGGCPIQHFALRMRAKNGRGEWLQLAPRLTSWQELFTIRDLLPSTSYELEVVAQNSAGATQAQYEFLTKGLGEWSAGRQLAIAVALPCALGAHSPRVVVSCANSCRSVSLFPRATARLPNCLATASQHRGRVQSEAAFSVRQRPKI